MHTLSGTSLKNAPCIDYKGDRAGKAAAPFPGEEVVMWIYDGPVPHKSRRNLILMSHAINTVNPATLEYHRWSESLITFDQMDHPSNIPMPVWFPIIINPLVRMTQLIKALMDGGSGLNLMYLDTFEGLGLTQDQL
jgi:hypothetical protein